MSSAFLQRAKLSLAGFSLKTEGGLPLVGGTRCLIIVFVEL